MKHLNWIETNLSLKYCVVLISLILNWINDVTYGLIHPRLHEMNEMDLGDCMKVESMTSEAKLHYCQKMIRIFQENLDSVLEKKTQEKRYSPISATLPEWKSKFVIERLKALDANPDVTTPFNTIAENSDGFVGIHRRPFMPLRNHTSEECRRLSQQELVSELKQKGTYNPDLMAWDVRGIIRFLDRSLFDQYERQSNKQSTDDDSNDLNIYTLERMLSELNLECNIRSPSVATRLQNLTSAAARRSIISPSIRFSDNSERLKRQAAVQELLQSLDATRTENGSNISFESSKKHQKIIGDVHVVPFGCDKRGDEEDGYLRLCSACQAIRRLPNAFFPPFINEVICDEDKACLFFYEHPHGKCKQKHMNFVVLKNVGTEECQMWQKFNLNVRVSCECFIDGMSFFAKYV